KRAILLGSSMENEPHAATLHLASGKISNVRLLNIPNLCVQREPLGSNYVCANGRIAHALTGAALPGLIFDDPENLSRAYASRFSSDDRLIAAAKAFRIVNSTPDFIRAYYDDVAIYERATG